MALPTHISTAGAQGGAISTNTNFYATTSANDIAIETFGVSGTNPTATAPSGWTEISNELYSTTYRVITAWKRCVANEPNHAWTGITGSNRFILSTVIRGCPTSGDPWDVLSTGQDSSSNTSLTAGLGTTVYSDCLYIIHIGCPASGTFGSQAAANLSSLTEQYDTSTTSHSRHCYTGGLAVAGAGGNFTATRSANSIDVWSIIALKSTSSVLSTSRGGRAALLGVGL